MIGLPKRHPRNLFLATKFEIILIGPVGSGKSTIAALLSNRLGLPRRSMDEVRWKYYDEIGYDWGTAKESHIQGGFWGLYHYWKPFEAYAVKRLLENFRDCVFDFGGGILFMRTMASSSRCANSWHLMPTSSCYFPHQTWMSPCKF